MLTNTLPSGIGAYLPCDCVSGRTGGFRGSGCCGRQLAQRWIEADGYENIGAVPST
jgi:hypothetical protein